MKTNDKDIEKMATEYADENYMVGNVSLNDFEYDMATDCYKAGFKACEAKMLAEASAGVERWQIENLSSDQSILIHDLTERAFTAGAMSQANRVKQLEMQVALSDTLYSRRDLESKLQTMLHEISHAVSYMEGNGYSDLEDCEPDRQMYESLKALLKQGGEK